ncbi:unnamed protein product [Choristocarpus tenellus]
MELIDTYVREGAPHQVNLSAEVRENILKAPITR